MWWNIWVPPPGAVQSASGLSTVETFLCPILREFLHPHGTNGRNIKCVPYRAVDIVGVVDDVGFAPDNSGY